MFGIMGMSFGIIGFAFGVISLSRVGKISRQLEEKGILEEPSKTD